MKMRLLVLLSALLALALSVAATTDSPPVIPPVGQEEPTDIPDPGMPPPGLPTQGATDAGGSGGSDGNGDIDWSSQVVGVPFAVVLLILMLFCWSTVIGELMEEGKKE